MIEEHGVTELMGRYMFMLAANPLATAIAPTYWLGPSPSGWQTAPSRARTYAREVDDAARIRDHFGMTAFPGCAALLRNGQPCSRTVAARSEFCVHHTKLLETVDAESLRLGRIPKKRALKAPSLRVVVAETEPTNTTITDADPANVRPSLALAAAKNLDALTDSLLHAAASATKPAWITVECSSCGERSRVEAPVPDVRARVAAIELLLREGLGRPATAEESHPVRLPSTTAAVKDMNWDDMQALFAATYIEEIAAAQREGGQAVLRHKLAALTDAERNSLSEALLELEHA